MRDWYHPPTPSDEYVRVSCATLALIEVEPGKVLLLASRHQLEEGRTVLIPPGGAIEVRGATALKELGASFEDETRMELRLRLRRTHVPSFKSWFTSRNYREVDPVRELVEELVDEAHLLPALFSSEIERRFLRTLEFWSPSQRRGAKGEITFYLHELFRVELAWHRIVELRSALAQGSELAGLVAPEEIAMSETMDGTKIGANAKALVAFL